MPSSDENQSVINEANELRYHITAVEEELDMANQQLADEEAKKSEKARLLEELSKKVSEDPARKKGCGRRERPILIPPLPYYKQQRDEQESSMRMMSQMSLIHATETGDENE